MRKATLSWLLLLIGAFGPIELSARQVCGGTERWAVKGGSDSGVDSVSLQPQSTTLQDLIHLDKVQLPRKGDDDTRLSEETSVYQFSAKLVMFKQEGDSDYHLVISDDGQFTPAGAKSHNPGHSLIAEIPDPNCIPGVQGEPDVHSKFIVPITCARNKMDAKFPDADKSGGDNDGGGVTVTITGVGFFDPAHGQIGRSLNNLEIHPILDIDFGDGQASCFQAPAMPPPPPPEPSLMAKTIPLPAGAPKPAKTIGRWEYKAVTAASADGLLTRVGALGVQRWELVSVAIDPKTKSYIGFLKRMTAR
jgi:hypothetical protein